MALKEAIIREMKAASAAEEILAGGKDTKGEKQAEQLTANLMDDIDEANLDPDAIKNQFNYSYREAQTRHTSIDGNWHASMSDKAIETVPPPVAEFCATATQWDIYDSYIAHFEEQKKLQEQQERELNRRRRNIGQSYSSGTTSKLGSANPASSSSGSRFRGAKENVLESEKLKRAIELMERIMNQNTHEDIISDFKV